MFIFLPLLLYTTTLLSTINWIYIELHWPLAIYSPNEFTLYATPSIAVAHSLLCAYLKYDFNELFVMTRHLTIYLFRSLIARRYNRCCAVVSIVARKFTGGNNCAHKCLTSQSTRYDFCSTVRLPFVSVARCIPFSQVYPSLLLLRYPVPAPIIMKYLPHSNSSLVPNTL